MYSFRSTLRIGAALLANLLVLATLACAAWLEKHAPDVYYRTVQEDQTLEWASFLAFFVAAVLFARAGHRQWRQERIVPWFSWGVAFFCFFVAMEEISWAQRIFAYRPPAYFLEHNFQQELNLHNIVDNDYRKLATKIVLLGYGVALPLLASIAPLRRALAGLANRYRLLAAVESPPLGLAPIFLATYIAFETYPWDFTGEWIELTMGFGFLFTALALVSRGQAQRPPRRQWAAVALCWAAVVAAGGALAFGSDALRRSDPGLLAAAGTELEALRIDLEALETACRGRSHINKRLYSYVERYGAEALLHGAFAGLVSQGLPEDRARFFLDPWNSPYWIRCSRAKKGELTYAYSFGPNRRRESTRDEILGDDVGVEFHRVDQGG